VLEKKNECRKKYFFRKKEIANVKKINDFRDDINVK